MWVHESPDALQPISQKFLQRRLWNGSMARRTDDGLSVKTVERLLFSVIIIVIIIERFYIALFSALKQTHCAHVARDSEWVTVSFYNAFLNIHRSPVLTATALFYCCVAGAMRNCCPLGARSVCTIQPCTTLQCHFIQSHMGRVYVCLAVTCHLHFWQNDRNRFRATEVTPWWNGYRNKSQYRKLTLQKNIVPPLVRRFEPRDLLMTSPAL